MFTTTLCTPCKLCRFDAISGVRALRALVAKNHTCPVATAGHAACAKEHLAGTLLALDWGAALHCCHEWCVHGRNRSGLHFSVAAFDSCSREAEAEVKRLQSRSQMQPWQSVMFNKHQCCCSCTPAAALVLTAHASYLVRLELLIQPPQLLNYWYHESQRLATACACIHCYVLVAAKQRNCRLLHWRRCLETQGLYYF